MRRPFVQLIVLIAAVMGLTVSGNAQVYTITAIDPVNLGTVAAGRTGETVLTVNPATGNVTTTSGSGAQVSPSSGRALVTIACGNNNACVTGAAYVTITTSGTPTNRASALRNFTVSTAGASAVIGTPPGTGSTITFTLQPWIYNASRTFWVGYDFPVKGDDSGTLSGTSTTRFTISVNNALGTKPSSNSGGIVSANVIRGLTISKSADLSFGRFFAPTSGSGVVTINQANGQVSVTGTGTTALPGVTPTVAQFAVAGEGGQSISVSVPSTFTMTAPGGTIQVTTSPNVSGAQVLSGTTGTLGALAIRVGGSYPVYAGMPGGNYSGTLAVMVQYN